MPFTFSHPAIVLPFFKNKKGSVTAMIVGSMSPDFEYFFRMRMQSEISHTFLGILLIDLPLGCIVIIVFHQIIKKPLIENLPSFFQKRLEVLKNSKWTDYFKSNILIVLVSFFLAAFSHVLWDSITHWDGFLVQRSLFLNQEYYAVPFYKIAQHLSSLVGLLFIFRYVHKLPCETQQIIKVSFPYWLSIFLFSLLIIAIRFTWVVNRNQIGDVVVGVISSVVLAMTIVSFIYSKIKFT